MTIRLATVEPSPDVFAAVMATGILSVAAADHRYTAISEALGVIASLGLVLLVLVAIATRRFSHWDLKDPAADLLRPAPDQQSSRNAALRRCVVGVRLPLGMYSAASYAMAVEIGQRALITVSLVFFWDALAAWFIVVVAGLLLACRALVSRSGS